MKGKVCKTVVRPGLESADINIVRLSLTVSRMDRIGNEDIRGTQRVGCFGHEAALRWTEEGQCIYLEKYVGDLFCYSVRGHEVSVRVEDGQG